MNARTTRSRRTAVQAAGAAVTLSAMIATPLGPQGGRVRRALTSVVVSGLFATTTTAAQRRWGASRTLAAAGVVVPATALIERIGTVTGVPFGRYRYTSVLRPRVGGVPLVVPLAWLAMALPARETAHAALGTRSAPLTRIVGGSAALTAWDLFLDPQMVGEGYWRWARRGAYRGIPVSNYLGWFLTGLGVMAVLEALLPPDDEPAADLVAEYGLMAVMETVGFAAFFRDRVVAAVGGAAMLPIAALGARRVLGSR